MGDGSIGSASASDGSIVIISFITRCHHQATSIEVVGPTAVGSSASSQTSRDSHWLAVSELSMLMSPRLDARGNDAYAGGGGAAAGGVASRFSGKGTIGLRADVSFSFGVPRTGAK